MFFCLFLSHNHTGRLVSIDAHQYVASLAFSFFRRARGCKLRSKKLRITRCTIEAATPRDPRTNIQFVLPADTFTPTRTRCLPQPGNGANSKCRRKLLCTSSTATRSIMYTITRAHWATYLSVSGAAGGDCEAARPAGRRREKSTKKKEKNPE